MKIFALIVLCLMVLFYIVVPGIEEYKKHKGSKKAIAHALVPLLVFVGSVLVGFILFEIIPRIVDNIFR